MQRACPLRRLRPRGVSRAIFGLPRRRPVVRGVEGGDARWSVAVVVQAAAVEGDDEGTGKQETQGGEEDEGRGGGGARIGAAMPIRARWADRTSSVTCAGLDRLRSQRCPTHVPASANRLRRHARPARLVQRHGGPLCPVHCRSQHMQCIHWMHCIGCAWQCIGQCITDQCTAQYTAKSTAQYTAMHNKGNWPFVV